MEITPKEFADRYLGEYKIKGNEINCKHCPFCGPNNKSDNEYKFYFNMEDGTFKCHRQNKCGAEGSFKDLKDHFNVNQPVRKRYKKPKVKTEIPTGKVEKYLKLRGISKKTWKNHNVKAKDGNIAFEYYHNGELVLIKYRTASKNKKYWQEGGGKPVLWEIDKVNINKPMIITEGEMDKLALHEAGLNNVVSVPFGSNNFEWLDHSWDKLEKLENIIIWADNDKAGQEMRDKLIKKLGAWRCQVVKTDYKDANILLYKEGKEAVKQAVEKAEDIPVKRLLTLNDIQEFDPTKIPSIKSFIPLLNKYIGGYMMGMVTIWTGTNGSGKSTFLSQEVINSIDQDFKTVLVTGELPHWLTRYWLELQAAGPDYIKSKWDNIRNEQSFYVSGETKVKIRNWAEDNLKIYDSFKSLKVDDLLETFTGAARQYDIKNFVVDNLMIINYDSSYREKYNKQAQFVKKMKDFARQHEAHVHIVAHPRKPKGSIITKEDVAGLYEITNLADNVICIHRVTKNNRKILKVDEGTENVLDIFKSRIYGMQELRVKLNFNPDCKRFEQAEGNAINKKYGWKSKENINYESDVEDITEINF